MKPRNVARAVRKAAQAVRIPASEGRGTVIAKWLRAAAIMAIVSWYAGLAAIDAKWPLWAALAVLTAGLAAAYALAKWGIRIQVKARIRKCFRRVRSQAITLRSSS